MLHNIQAKLARDEHLLEGGGGGGSGQDDQGEQEQRREGGEQQLQRRGGQRRAQGWGQPRHIPLMARAKEPRMEERLAKLAERGGAAANGGLLGDRAAAGADDAGDS